MKLPVRARLIFNPVAGRRGVRDRDASRVVELLAGCGVEASLAPTASPRDATRLAREAVESGFDRVIAWGGDGTLHEVARGLVGTGVPLGVLPGGTVNVFAREAGIPLKLEAACRLLAGGEPRAIPIGLAGEHPFLSMAGIGLDAEVVHRVDLAWKRRLGVLAFWIVGFRLLASYSFAPLRVRIGGETHEGTSVVVCNLPRYGTGYVMAPRARLEEPLLDMVLFQGRRARDYLRYLAGVAGRFHLRFRDVVYRKATDIEVEADPALRCQLDGEAIDDVPKRIRLLDGELTVILPPSVPAKPSQAAPPEGGSAAAGRR